VVSDAHRVGHVLDNLRALFGKVEREHEPIDLNKLAVDALRAMRAELSDHRIAASLDLASELPPVMGHGGQLQEVMMNLLHNAIDALRAIKSDRRTLSVRTRRDTGNAIVVEVEDSGPGIDPNRLESIFDAFVTTKPQGTGLGLAISRMIIERHGGQLSARSNGKDGALFRLVLPSEAIGGK
jgi:signal transduction histidine kinase